MFQLVKKLKLHDVFDNKYILLLTGGMMLLTVGINFVYYNSILRYIIVGLFIGAIVVFILNKRTLVKGIVKKIIK